MTRKDLQFLSRIRLSEAKVLLNAGLPDGAYYLAGYAVECALKACIAKGTQRYDFPDKKIAEASYTHNLKELIRVAKLESARSQEATNAPEFDTNWNIVQQWSEQSRYERHSEKLAQPLIEAISSPKDGIMTWVKRHW